MNTQDFTYPVVEELIVLRDTVDRRTFHVFKTNEGPEGVVALLIQRIQQVSDEKGLSFGVCKPRAATFPDVTAEAHSYGDPTRPYRLGFWVRAVCRSEEDARKLIDEKLAEVRKLTGGETA